MDNNPMKDPHFVTMAYAHKTGVMTVPYIMMWNPKEPPLLMVIIYQYDGTLIDGEISNIPQGSKIFD